MNSRSIFPINFFGGRGRLRAEICKLLLSKSKSLYRLTICQLFSAETPLCTRIMYSVWECRLWLASICAVSGTVSSSSTLPAGGFSMKAMPRRAAGTRRRRRRRRRQPASPPGQLPALSTRQLRAAPPGLSAAARPPCGRPAARGSRELCPRHAAAAWRSSSGRGRGAGGQAPAEVTSCSRSAGRHGRAGLGASSSRGTARPRLGYHRPAGGVPPGAAGARGSLPFSSP